MTSINNESAGLVVDRSQIVLGGRNDIPAGTGVSGDAGSRFNEIHTPVPGTENFREVISADNIGAWVDARTGLLRFDRLPDGFRYVARYQNANGGQYSGFLVSTPPLTNTTPPVLPPPAVDIPQTPAPLPPINAINLRDFISVSNSSINRTYLKGSLLSIDSERITITNTSTVISIDVTLVGIAGISFTPSSFTIPAGGSVDVTVNFDVSVINQYPDGVSTANCAINLTSKDAVISQQPPIVVDPRPVPDPFIPTVPLLPPVQPPVFDPPPSLPIPQPAPLTWLNGVTRQTELGLPPAGWLRDPFNDGWYPPDDPLVLNNFAPFGRVTPQQLPPNIVVPSLPDPPPPPPPTGGGLLPIFFDGRDINAE